MDSPRLTPAEVAMARYNRAEAEASLACEGIHLTDAEKALFDRFEAEALPHDEPRRQILDYIGRRQQPGSRCG